MEKRLQQILARKAEIQRELAGANEARFAELNTEAESLMKEEAETRSRMDLSGKLGTPESKPEGRGNMSDAEKRGRDLREKRAVTISSGSLVQPKKTGGINGEIGVTVSSIVDLVKAVPCEGMGAYQVAYQKTGSEAAKTAEGADASQSDPTFGYADIVPVKVATYSTITREALKLSDQDYYSRVQESALAALKKKASAFIINSDAASSAKFIGILAAGALEASNDVSLTAIDAGTLRKIALNYGGDESIIGDAVLFLNKKDLIAFGDVRGTSEKKAVFDITPDASNPNTGIIKDGGLSIRYCINSNLTDLAAQTAGKYSMVYGIPGCYELGMFSDYSILVSEDAEFKKGMIAVLGEVMLGGNVTVQNGFVRVKKGASS